MEMQSKWSTNLLKICKLKLHLRQAVNLLERFLGWYVDGEWGVDNKELSFLKFKEKSFLMTNNIMVKSSHIKVDMSFTIEQRREPATKSKGKISTTEVLVVGLSNNLYRIKSFDPFVPIVDMHGYGLLFFKSKEGYIVYLEQFEEQNLYNLQTAFDIEVSADPRRLCTYEYLGVKTDLQILMNFETETIHVMINGHRCIDYKINNRLFTEPKIALTFAGFSSNLNPIQIKMHETSISKGAYASAKDFEQTFHNDVDSFIKTLNKYDPKHGQNASFSNVMLTQVT